jgi:putative tryptophan/tyrosine transport system substrate-binding protein
MERRGSSLSRRQFVTGAGVAGLGLVAGCGRLPGQGQAPAKVSRLGILVPVSATVIATQADYPEAFRQGLHELGYVEGQNIVLDWRYTEGRNDLAARHAVELARVPVDIIVAFGTPAALAASHATTTIPIIVPICVDPVGNGLVASLARPGGNVTGLAVNLAELSGKRLQLLKEISPGLTRVGVLGNPDNADPAAQWRELQAAGPALGLQLYSLEVPSPNELDSAFDTATQRQVEALFVLGDPLTAIVLRERVVEFAFTRRLPAMYDQRLFVGAGGLISYGPNIPEQVRRAAYYVDRIVKGTSPADLPVEQPMTFDFVVNMKTARDLGITFPNEIMLQVTEVIQ